MSGKVFGGALGGVAIPIVIEFGAKGARISDSIPYKWSGVVGTVGGVFTGLLPLVWKEYPLTKGMATEDKHAVMAFGGAMFGTGLSILILDELRKRAAYTFRGELPLTEGYVSEREGLELPPEELIKEI
jgi:hypothetical protein